MRPTRSRMEGGFTLIELMIVVAIIGILSSIAIPNLQRAQLRTKIAERPTIMEAIARAVGETVMSGQGKLPDDTDPLRWIGPANPAGPPTTHKRPFTYIGGGWRFMPLIVQGDCYFSYSFQVDLQPSPASMWVLAVGDLDGDGAPTTKLITYTSAGFTFFKDPLNPEFPEPGAEDDVTFHTF